MDAENCAELKALTGRVGVLEGAGTHERVLALEEANTHIKLELERNTQTTNAIKTDTATLVEFAQTFQATRIVGKILAKLLMWVALVAGGFSAAIAVWGPKK